MKTFIYLVRHGESEHNRDNILSGHVNPALTEKGRAQALETRQKLSDIKFDAAYSSDLQRAVSTAALIYGSDVPVSHQFSELRERNYGSLDGSPIDDYNAVKQANRERLSDLDDHEKWLFKHAPDIESDDEISFRFLKAITAIAEDNLGKNVLVAAHGGVLRTTLIRLGYATSKQLPSQSVENAAFVELRYENSKFTIGQLSGIHRRSN